MDMIYSSKPKTMTDRQVMSWLSGGIISPQRDFFADMDSHKVHAEENPDAFAQDLNYLLPILDRLGW